MDLKEQFCFQCAGRGEILENFSASPKEERSDYRLVSCYSCDGHGFHFAGKVFRTTGKYYEQIKKAVERVESQFTRPLARSKPVA